MEPSYAGSPNVTKVSASRAVHQGSGSQGDSRHGSSPELSPWNKAKSVTLADLRPLPVAGAIQGGEHQPRVCGVRVRIRFVVLMVIISVLALGSSAGACVIGILNAELGVSILLGALNAQILRRGSEIVSTELYDLHQANNIAVQHFYRGRYNLTDAEAVGAHLVTLCALSRASTAHYVALPEGEFVFASCLANPPNFSVQSCGACDRVYYTPGDVAPYGIAVVESPWRNLTAFGALLPQLPTPWAGLREYARMAFNARRRPWYVPRPWEAALS